MCIGKDVNALVILILMFDVLYGTKNIYIGWCEEGDDKKHSKEDGFEESWYLKIEVKLLFERNQILSCVIFDDCTEKKRRIDGKIMRGGDFCSFLDLWLCLYVLDSWQK